jgi:hypothetical protein
MTRLADDSGALDGVGRGWRGDYSLRSWCQGVRVSGCQGDRENDSPDTLTPCDPDTLTPSPITLTERRFGERQFHLESGTDDRRWIGGQGPAVGGNDAACQIEPDPEPR